MSHVTDIILTLSVSEEGDEEASESPAMAAVQDYLASVAGSRLAEIDDDRAGGNKRHQRRIYTGAFRSFDIAGFLRVVASVAWERPGCVQVFVKDEHDERFAAYHIADPSGDEDPPCSSIERYLAGN